VRDPHSPGKELKIKTFKIRATSGSMPDEFLPYVSIVIPVFNEERYLHSCLTSIMSLSYPKGRHEVLLVDNGSTDRTIEIAQEFSAVSIHVKETAKVGAVRNYGVQKAIGSVIVFLDSDCVVSQDWLTDGIRKLTANPGSVIGGQYLLREDPSWLEKYWILTSQGRTVTQTSLLGGCIFIPKEIFQKVGGFDEHLNAGEDSDLTLRLKKEHFNVGIDPSLSVVHLGYPSRLWPFLARQLWHSSDYINGLPHTLRDKIFLLTLAFMAGVLGLLGSLIFLPAAKLTLIVFVFLVFISPALLSIKRIIRSGAKYESLFDYVSIYLVDWLYLIGRVLGILSGIKNRISFRSDAKVGRR
jgi:glycosyltransferase involved in cell wall biosynthesis